MTLVVAAATEALGDLLTLRREALMRTAGRCECLRGLLQAHECLWGPARAYRARHPRIADGLVPARADPWLR